MKKKKTTVKKPPEKPSEEHLDGSFKMNKNKKTTLYKHLVKQQLTNNYHLNNKHFNSLENKQTQIS